jgi:hypothetical protein
MNADSLYRTFYASLGDQEKSRHYRIDPAFPCAPLALDDASALPMIQQMTRKQMFRCPSMARAVKSLSRAMIAKGFYPILKPNPVFAKGLGLHTVHLAVVSRWEDNPSVSAQLRDYLSQASFHIQGAKYPAKTPLEITLTLSTLDDELDIDLAFRDGARHKISGLPLSARQILLLQHQAREECKPCDTNTRWSLKRACPHQDDELHRRKRARHSIF